MFVKQTMPLTPLQPFLFTEKQKTQQDDREADDDDDGIGIRIVQFRHVLKVHAVPAHDQGQGHKNSGDRSILPVNSLKKRVFSSEKNWFSFSSRIWPTSSSCS